MQDPFAGRERLNQLTPTELQSRNDRMSGQTEAKSYNKDKSQGQLDEESRDHYRNMNQARYLTSDQIASTLLPVPSSGSAPVLSTSSKTEDGNNQQNANPTLPLGWSERLNQASSVSDLDTNIKSHRLDVEGAERAQQLETIRVGITALRARVDVLMDEFMALSEDDDADPKKVAEVKNQLKTAREQLKMATSRETELKAQIGQ